MFRSRELAKQAKRDYEQARGTAHKYLLQSARKSLTTQIADLDKEIAPLNEKLSEAVQKRNSALRRDLSGHLVRNHLMEVSGVGPTRLAALIQIFRGELKDLHRAQQLVDGIGEQTQSALNRWIAKYEQQMPQLLQQSFPGKSSIVAEYEAKEKEISSEAARLGKQKNNLQETKLLVDGELSWLEEVSSSDFRKALKDTSITYPQIDRYLIGVFSEWEQMPNWFHEALAVSGQQAPIPKPVARTTPAKKNIALAQRPVVRSTLVVDTEEIAQPPEGTPVVTIEDVAPDSNNESKGDRRKPLPAWSWLIIILLFCGCLYSGMLVDHRRNATPIFPTSTPMPTRTATSTRIPPATSMLVPLLAVTASPSAAPTTTPSLTPSPSPTPSATLSPTPVPLFVLNRANLRSGPGTEFGVIAQIQPQEPLILLEVNDGQTWYRVALQNGLEGWVGGSMLALPEE